MFQRRTRRRRHHFRQDGDADHRGRSAPLGHTGESPAGIRRLAVLVSHPDFGARTVIYDR